jgi:very-short-patch-repair endonuclease
MKLLFTTNHISYSPSGTGGSMHYGAHPLIFKRAEELRNNMTHAEELLWNYLKVNEWGYKFRRQHPLFMYVADFYCHQLKLIIDIDGSIHELEDVKRNDAVRENHLKSLGLKIIRFKNEDVMNNLETVLVQIKKYISHEE